MSLTTKILTAAMASDKHVFVQYSPHCKSLSVYAYPGSTDYTIGASRTRLMDETVYLDWANAAEKLAELLEMVEGL